MRGEKVFVAALAASAISAPAAATIHSYSFAGVRQGDPSLTASGYVSFDDAAAPTATQLGVITYYNALTNFQATGTNFSFVAVPGTAPDGDTAVGDGTLGGKNDTIGFFGTQFSSVTGGVISANLLLTDRTNSSWTSQALPTSLTLPTLTERTLQVQIGGNVFNYTLSPLVPIAAIPSVPEPASWAMMILGFGAAGAAMRRRRTERAVWGPGKGKCPV